MSDVVTVKHNYLASRNNLFNVTTVVKGDKRPAGIVQFSNSFKSQEKLKVPEGQGIGLFTGIHDHQKEGVLLIDIDVFEDSDYARELAVTLYNCFVELFPELAGTSQTKTPSGGFHFYVKIKTNIKGYNNQPSIKLFFDDDRKPMTLPIDIKAEGGFVVIAPSPYYCAGKEWKRQYEGMCYEEILDLDEHTIQYASDALLSYIQGKKSLKLYEDLDGPHLIILDDAAVKDNFSDFKPAKSTSSGSDDELNTISDELEQSAQPEEEYIGFIKNADCLKEVLLNLHSHNLETYEVWRNSMMALVHVFGEHFGGELKLRKFQYLINEHCEKFPNFDDTKNDELIEGFWAKTAEKMYSYGKLVEMITANLGGTDEYNRWCIELNKKGLYKFREVKDTGKYKKHGDLKLIKPSDTLADVREYFKSTVRLILDDSGSLFVRKLSRDINRNLPGIRFVNFDELDRYYEWKMMDEKNFNKNLSKFHIYLKGKKKDKKYTIKTLFENPENRVDITYDEAIFIPEREDNRTTSEEHEQVKKSLDMYGEFNYAPKFRARMKYTREEAMKHHGYKVMSRHLKEILANGDEKAYSYLTGVLAHICQFPSIQSQVMCVFRDVGSGGNGKSVFAVLLSAIFGSLFKFFPVASLYLHKFETVRASKIFCWIDELNDKDVDMHRLKTLITGGVDETEGKNQNKKEKLNYNNIWAACNDVKVLNIKPGEARRYAVFDVNQTKARSKEYINELVNLGQDDLDAYFCYLMSIDIATETCFVKGEGFRTAALTETEAGSICSIDKFFIDIIKNDFTCDDTDCYTTYVEEELPNGETYYKTTGINFHRGALYKKYEHHTKTSGKHPLSSNNFDAKLLRLFGPAQRYQFNKARRDGYKLTIDTIESAIKRAISEKTYETFVNVVDAPTTPEDLFRNKDNNADFFKQVEDEARGDNII